MAAALVLVVGVVVAVVAGLPLAAQSQPGPRLLILGFDGVDSNTTERLMKAGQLPHLAKLAEQGSYVPLMPTNPAQSPVSWASISTGLGPGNHGIYDFLSRDLSAGDSPAIEIGLVKQGKLSLGSDPLRGLLVMALGGIGCMLGGLFSWFVLGSFNRAWRRGGRLQAVALLPGSLLAVAGMMGSAWVPESIPSIENMRGGEPFWQTLDRAQLRCIALEAPVAFPADHMNHGACLSGLGVPDVQQSWGFFAVWTNDPRTSAESETGGFGYFVNPRDGRFEMVLRGPPNPLADAQDTREAKTTADSERDTRRIAYDWSPVEQRTSETREALLRMTDRMTVTLPVVLGGDDTATVTLQDGTQVVLKKDTWSELLPVKFAANPLLKVSALTQMCLVTKEPLPGGRGVPFEIFVAPTQFDPSDVPLALDLSSPHGFAGEIAASIGPYPTLGWQELTGPVKDDWLADTLFLKHTYTAMAHRERKLKDQLAKSDWDCVFAVFTEQDRVQHAMYRHIDPKVPRHDPELVEEFGGEIDKIYREMDRIVGDAIASVKDGRPTQVIVISDHGFAPFRRGVNLTNFLRAKSYQVPHKGEAGGPSRVGSLFDPSKVWFKDVDWSKTVAYGMGLGNIYLNKVGREQGGIVRPEQEAQVLDNIKRDLLALRDVDGSKVVRNVYFGRDLFPGERSAEAPDIVVGFEWGYRVSWQSSLGSMDAEIITDNPFRWSGDHCSVDPPLVQGVWFSSMALPAGTKPTVTDVGPTVLGLFGLKPPATDGSDLLSER